MGLRTLWQAVLDPGSATDFFAGADERQAFVPGLTDWHRQQAWWCSEISRTIYRRDGRGDYLSRVGLRELRYFDAGSTQAALLQGHGFAVLVFRGTADLRDWLTNVRAAPVPWPDGGKVHEGFRSALDRVWVEIASDLAKLDDPVFVTGHSLGGALGTLAAARHAFAAAYTFGAPRVGDATFWSKLRAPLHRVVNDRDVVPTMPPRRFGYADGGMLHHLAADGSMLDGAMPDASTAAVQRDAERSLRERWLEPPGPLADHAPVHYSRRLVRSVDVT